VIVGVGQSESAAVRKGEIDLDAAVESIHSMSDAEESAGVEIHNVLPLQSGGHIRVSTRGSVIITNDEREITDEQVSSVP
jgi:cell division ATPase FtsA